MWRSGVGAAVVVRTRHNRRLMNLQPGLTPLGPRATRVMMLRAALTLGKPGAAGRGNLLPGADTAEKQPEF